MHIKTTIKFESKIYEAVKNFLLQNQIEQFCFLFCHISKNTNDIIIYPKKIIAFENDSTVVEQHRSGLCIDKLLVNEAYIRFAESEYSAIVNCHSHPFEKGDVWFSSIDDESDIEHTKYVLSELTKAKSKFNKNNQIFFIQW